MSKRESDDFGINQAIYKAPYNPKDCQVGVIHIGLGNFHRAHQAVYFHKLLSKTKFTNWGIAAVNLRPKDSSVVRSLRNCDNKYILKTISPNGDIRYEEIKSILAAYEWREQQEDVLLLFSSSDIQLITITVTEGGYYFDNNHHLDLSAPDIRDDLESDTPKTIFGSLYQGLRYRMVNGGGPITVSCCDNLQGNGQLLEKCFVQYISAKNDIDLLHWVAENVSFPSSMVDRITPKGDINQLQEINKKFGLKDNCSVIAEEYIQWVIEDNFAGTRLPLEDVGVEIVENVQPYEEAKIHILNAGHTVLTYLGILRGYTTYDSALLDPELSVFFDSIQVQEILPALNRESNINHKKYLEITKERLSNQYISDSLARISVDGATKFTVFLLPVIEWNLSKGLLPEYSIRAIAGWYVFLCKVITNGIEFDYIDPKWDILVPYLIEGGEHEFAHSSKLWGDIPQRHPDFANKIVEYILALKVTYNVNI
ncbi:MAG: mannitol dehydrogenase family protein [Candidatus Thioglobus sp.]|jgi:D-arabinitol 4-dehydrogenase